MSNIYSEGVRVGQLNPLRRILVRWKELNMKFGLKWIKYDNIAPWWFNERASLSFFAGAVWRCDGWALEEFSTTKVDISTRERKYKHGRCDLNFGIGRHEFIAEAKQCWPNISNIPNAKKTIEESLGRACLECNQMDWDYPRLGMVFAVPRLHQSKQEKMDFFLQQFVNELLKINDTALAWTFPKSARRLRPDNLYRHYIFPGVALLIRKAA